MTLAAPTDLPRSPAQLALTLLGPAVLAGVLVWRLADGAPAWACALGLVGVAAWTVRNLLRPRLDAARRAGAGRLRGLDLALLLAMLVPSAFAGIPGDVAAFAPALASIIAVLGGALLPVAGQAAWCVAAAVLAALGAAVGPFHPWAAALSVGLLLLVGVLAGVARRHGAIGAERARAAELARHAAELAAARGNALDPVAVRERFPGLSPREAEVLGLMARGRSNDEIAAELFVSVATVKSHVNALFAKLPARDRAHAIAIAYGTALPG